MATQIIDLTKLPQDITTEASLADGTSYLVEMSQGGMCILGDFASDPTPAADDDGVVPIDTVRGHIVRAHERLTVKGSSTTAIWAWLIAGSGFLVITEA